MPGVYEALRRTDSQQCCTQTIDKPKMQQLAPTIILLIAEIAAPCMHGAGILCLRWDFQEYCIAWLLGG